METSAVVDPRPVCTPLEARSGFHPTGVSPQVYVGLGCGGTGAADPTTQSNLASASVKSGRMG